MTPQQIIGLGLRICALWLLLNSITFLYSLPRALLESESLTDQLGWSYAVGIAYVVVPILIWIFPMMIAHALVPAKSHAARMADPVFVLARVASVLFGIIMLAVSGNDLVRHLLITFFNHKMGLNLASMPTDWIMQAITYVAAMAFGLTFVFGSSLFAYAVSQRQASSDSNGTKVEIFKSNSSQHQ